ncbi:4'-phosphopantetheinyl transferase superfamily protein [Leisingera thetidis]|uniref:4'-phosphopantetheinyl transferase superfamily protein n=1 Tax=Leisingera thetidis TaxID=2930199 RepID=UPI0021F7E296|nr:4'-phosphopantetheinyl transferase superfamily protein [Leisingera thetidis]
MLDFPRPFGAALVHIEDTHPVPPGYARNAEFKSPRRRMEFLAGRRAAGRALARAGAPQVTVPKGPGGAPVWPEGWSGSISHDRGRAVAVVTTADHHVGIDLEDLTRLSRARAVSRLCLSEAERVLFPDPRAALCAFSAKEAVFKAMAPAAASRFWLSAIRFHAREDNRIFWHIPQLEQTGQVHVFQTARQVLSVCRIPARHRLTGTGCGPAGPSP